MTAQTLAPQIADILKFSELMGNKVGDQSKIDLYVDLLNEEFNGQGEFRQSLRAGDKIGVRDGLADIFVVAVLHAHLCGYHFTDDSLTNSEIIKNSIQGMYVTSNFFQKLSEILHENASGINDTSNTVVLLAQCSFIAGDNFAADLDAVMKSNFSKFCKSNYDAVQSSDMWHHKGVNCEYRETGDEDYPYSIHAAEDTKQYPKGKLLKPIGFKEPVFSEVA